MNESVGRWAAARGLFESALALPDAERESHMSSVATAPEVLAEALELLIAHRAAGDFLSGGPEETLREDMPDRVGAWRLVREIGRGGMGTVFLGERDSGDFSQRVAIKIVTAGVPSPVERQRFEAERRLLGALDHPGIAKILDAGSTATGSMYFAMELVEGRPVVEWCQLHAVELETRLRLGVEIAEAVEHAHQRLIVHRDLKPSNILVDDAGRPKLLDFGIAKLVGPEPDGRSNEGTRTFDRAMTPAYASPEQILGGVTTTATDVHGLGILLFELLTGRHPFRRAGQSDRDLEEAILHLVPRRASVVVLDPEAPELLSRRAVESGAGPFAAGLAAKRLSRRLRGDADRVLGKALEKEPARRYASVGELAADLRALLDGRPVRARPVGLWERGVRVVRRHRAAAVASALVALLLAGTVTGYTLRLRREAERARLAEASARAEAVTAQRVTDLLVELFEASDVDRSRRANLTARQLLEVGAERIDERLAGEPLVRARLLRVIGRAFQAIGLYDRQALIAEKEVEVRAGISGAATPEYAEARAFLARALFDRGDAQQARAIAAEALAIQRAAFGDRHAATASTRNELGRIEARLGHLDAAGEHLETALQFQETRADRDDAALAAVLSNLGSLHWQRGENDRALARYGEALAAFERAHGPEHPAVAGALNNLAIAENQAGRQDLSKAHHDRALGMRRMLLGPDHPDVGESFNNLGNTLRDAGDLDGALAAFEEALRIRERSLGESHALVGTSLYNLGNVLADLDRFADARPALTRAHAVMARALGEEHYRVGFPLSALAWVDFRSGRTEDSERRFRRSLELLGGTLPPDHPAIRSVRENFIRMLRGSRRIDEATRQELLLSKVPPD